MTKRICECIKIHCFKYGYENRKGCQLAAFSVANHISPRLVGAAAKGHDHKNQQRYSYHQGEKTEAFYQEVINDAAGVFGSELLRNPCLLVTFPLIPTFLYHLFLADPAIEDNKVHRELLRAAMSVE